MVPNNTIFLLSISTQKRAFFSLPSVLFPVGTGFYVTSSVERMQSLLYLMYGKRLYVPNGNYSYIAWRADQALYGS